MVLIASHPVGGLVLNPFLGKTGKGVYNWLFVIGIVSAALWVVIAWYAKAAPLLQKLEESPRDSSAISPIPSQEFHSPS